MKIPHVTALLACVAVIAFASGAAFTEDEAKPKPLSPQAMEAKVMQLGAACPAHEVLKRLAGTWDVKGKAVTHMMGDIPFAGVVTMKPAWEGRFLETAYEGPGMMPDQKMLGAGVLGFNRLSGKYEGTWRMNMGTNISFITGTFDKDSNTFHYTGSAGMPDGTTWSLRQTMVIESEDKLVETQWTTPPGGKESMAVQMTYTRRAGKPTTGK